MIDVIEFLVALSKKRELTEPEKETLSEVSCRNKANAAGVEDTVKLPHA